jgi:cyclic pyranopterin phosphate synthase
LSTEGVLYTCLFADSGFDLRGQMRAGASDEALAAGLAGMWSVREDRDSELRTAATAESRRKVEMSYIGG